MDPIFLLTNDVVPLHSVVAPQFSTMGMTVRLSHVKGQLVSSNWLHCDLVNDWRIMINDTFFDRQYDRSFVACTYFYNRYFDFDVYSFEKVKRWTSTWELEDENLNNFHIPIHINMAHWFVMIVRKKEKEIWLVDSMPNRHQLKYFRNVMQFWHDYMQSRGVVDLDLSEWKFVLKNTTRQVDSDSCGIYMCSNILMSCHDINVLRYPDEWKNSFKLFMLYCFHLPYLFSLQD